LHEYFVQREIVTTQVYHYNDNKVTFCLLLQQNAEIQARLSVQ